MDSLPAHRVEGVRGAIEARGATLLHPPPCSPDLNPIEQAFARLEAPLRKAAERTVDGLRKATGRLLDRFSAAECADDLARSGYPRSARKHSRAKRGQVGTGGGRLPARGESCPGPIQAIRAGA